MIKDDWLMRTIRQLVEALARVVGLAKAGQVDDAKRELERLYGTQLGMPRKMIDRLDAATVLTMLGGDKGKLLLMLLAAEVEVEVAVGAENGALSLRARASQLRAELARRAST